MGIFKNYMIVLSVAMGVLFACDDEESNANVETEAGMSSGTEAGMPSGTEAGELAGMPSGTEAGELAGMLSGTEAGMPSGTEAGTEGGQVPGPHLPDPKANVFLNDPITNEQMLTEVTLAETSTEDGRFTSQAVEVFNCLNQPGGLTGNVNFGLDLEISLCLEEQVARPDSDGNYLSITPPEDYTDPNDSFAEVMMYYHVNEVFDYYKEQHDYERYEEPLPALVNVQLTTNPQISLPGLTPNPDGFIPLDNALFFPKENWEYFASQFGLPARDDDLIVFFQGQADFAYDASVIYHEYTHAVIGIDRLQYNAFDEYGLDASPPGMNEGLADYFAATILDQSQIGPYGIATLSEDAGRDLAEPYQCPNETHWEVHIHGRIIGSTMWAIRELMGAEKADQIMFNALDQFTRGTTHQDAAELILAEASGESAEMVDQIREILKSYGMLDCVRSKQWQAYTPANSDGVPYLVNGKESLGVPTFNATGIPAYKQFYVSIPEDKAAVKLSWRSQTPPSVAGNGTPKALNIAYKAGSHVRMNFGPTSLGADGELTPELVNNTQTIIWERNCFDDVDAIHTLFLNDGAEDIWITNMQIEYLDDVSGVTLSECVRAETMPQCRPEWESLTNQDLRDAVYQDLSAQYQAIEPQANLGGMLDRYTTARNLMYTEVERRENSQGQFGVSLAYTGGFQVLAEGAEPDHREVSCEHTWPRSRLSDEDTPYYVHQEADLHHLLPTVATVNSLRGSFIFGEPVSSLQDDYFPAVMGLNANGTQVFTPRAAFRGDVARIIFYMSSRWGLDITQEEEEVLRRWHVTDPVDDWEIEKNGRIEALQGNRNPFIDCPILVDQIDDFQAFPVNEMLVIP